VLEPKRSITFIKQASYIESATIRDNKKSNSNKFLLDATSIEKTESFEQSKIFDNKVMSLFSPKPCANLCFRGIKNPIEKLYSSLEAIFDNPGNITIHLPILFEASKSNPKHLNNVNFEKGNYLFLFLDNSSEILFGILICNVFGRNTFKFFKVNAEKDTNRIEYHNEILNGMKYLKDMNELRHNGYFGFNMNNYVFNCDNKVLSNFLSVVNIILYSNINYIKIYDMC
jgi:hypothetical protein